MSRVHSIANCGNGLLLTHSGEDEEMVYSYFNKYGKIKRLKLGKLIDVELVKKYVEDSGFIYIDILDDKIIYKDNDEYYYSRNKYFYKKISTKNKSKFRESNIFKIKNIETMISKNNIYNTKIIGEISSSSDKVEMLCGMCKNKFKIHLYTFEDKTYKVCENCSRKLQKTKLTDKNIVIDNIIKNELIPMFDEYKGYSKRLKVMDKDGYMGLLSYSSVVKGVKNISKFAKHNPYALYNLRLYFKKNKINCTVVEQKYLGWDLDLKLICNCGNEFTTNVSKIIHDNKIQCNECSKRISKNEYKISGFLDKNNIKYIKEYKFIGCKNKYSLPFDFYLPDYNMCIECDGEHHYKPVKFGGITKEKSEINYKKTKYRDSIKDKYCKENNISLIRISYIDIKNDNYKNIIESLFSINE